MTTPIDKLTTLIHSLLSLWIFARRRSGFTWAAIIVLALTAVSGAELSTPSKSYRIALLGPDGAAFWGVLSFAGLLVVVQCVVWCIQASTDGSLSRQITAILPRLADDKDSIAIANETNIPINRVRTIETALKGEVVAMMRVSREVLQKLRAVSEDGLLDSHLDPKRAIEAAGKAVAKRLREGDAPESAEQLADEIRNQQA